MFKLTTNALNQVISGAHHNAKVKSAAINTGAVLVQPTQFGNHGGGMVDPDPNAAHQAKQSEMRAAASFMGISNDTPVGTDLKDYKNLLNEADQTIAYSMNPVKSASTEDLTEFRNKCASYEVGGEKLFKSGYVPATPDVLETQIVNPAKEKAASKAQDILNQALADGTIDKLVPQYKPFLVD